MLAWSKIAPDRRDLLADLVGEYAHNYARGRTVLAVDGPDGAGTREFADDLALAFRRAGYTVARASVDDFRRPRAERLARGADDPEGRYRDEFDYSVLRRVLVEPFRMGGSSSFVTAAFDVDRDAPLEPDWQDGPADLVLIIDGVFLNRPELAGLWNWSIWLDADEPVRFARLAELTGADPDPDAPSNDRLTGALRMYVADAHPNTRADAIVDNTDPARPKRRFADYCSVPPPPTGVRARGRRPSRG